MLWLGLATWLIKSSRGNFAINLFIKWCCFYMLNMCHVHLIDVKNTKCNNCSGSIHYTCSKLATIKQRMNPKQGRHWISFAAVAKWLAILWKVMNNLTNLWSEIKNLKESIDKSVKVPSVESLSVQSLLNIKKYTGEFRRIMSSIEYNYGNRSRDWWITHDKIKVARILSVIAEIILILWQL